MIAVLDIGSNSVRLLLQFSDFKKKFSKITRLAEGLYNTGVMKSTAISRTVKAVKCFCKLAIKERAEHVYLFGTEALRSAGNFEEFLYEVNVKTGLTVDIISGESEAFIGYLGVANVGDNAGVVDIGGASTEVTVNVSEGQLRSKSIPVGTVKLIDAHSQDETALTEYLDGIINYDFSATKNMYLVGGTGATLSAMDLELDKYSDEAVNGHILTIARIMELKNRIFSVEVKKRNFKGLSKNRRDVIGTGTLTLLTVMKKLNLQEIKYSSSDNLEGYLKYKSYLENNMM